MDKTHHFEMYTGEGDEALAEELAPVLADLQARKFTEDKALSIALRSALVRVMKRGHNEVYDTAVREAIFTLIEDDVTAAGLDVDEVFSDLI